MPTIADLTAKFTADTSGLVQGAQVAKQTLQGVADQAGVATRALEIMAQAASKANPGQGSPAQILEFFQRGNVQPTAAALTQARSEMERVASAAAQAVAPTQAIARASKEHAEATANGARATQNVADGWKMSESSLVRFGAGLAGIGLGFSLVAGAAKLIHDTVVGIGEGVLDWERSLRSISGLYGEAGANVAAFAQAQSNLPNVLGTNQEFAQAAINASALTQRYGLPQRVTDQLTTTGGRVAFALNLNDRAERQALQAQLLQAVTSGAQIPQLGIYTDPEAVARRLGAPGAQTLQAYTPQEILTARAAITSGQGNAFAAQAEANQRGVLDATRATEKALERARSNVTNVLESGFGNNPIAAAAESGILAGGFGLPQGVAGHPERGPQRDAGLGALQGNVEDSLRGLVVAQTTYAETLADSERAQEESRQTFERLSQSVDAAGARLLGFFGSLEDQTSIGHGDILAQAQASVTARARSATPLFGIGPAEISALAAGDAWQAAWQNFVATQAQGPQANAIQRNLQQQADTSRFRTLGADRQDARITAATAAQRALDQAANTGPLFEAQRGAQTRAAQVDLAGADIQSRLDAISLTQRERQIQLLRDTIDLRRLDLTQQQAGLRLTEDVIRAQQAALPVQAATSAARYQQNIAGAISLQRMARLLQGRDVSDLPTVDQLINQNYRGQLAEAELAPSAVNAARGIEVAQQPATAAGLANALTGLQIRDAELANELKNLADLPQQTALELALVENNRSQLSVQTEMREYLKKIAFYMEQGGRVPQLVPADRGDRMDAGAPRASGDLAGARR